MSFKDRLKARRNALGLTLEEVGNAVGVSKTTVARWESGIISSLRGDKINKLAAVLSCEPSYLMEWEENEDRLDINSIEYAIYGEARNLDEDEKRQLLELARLMRKKRREAMNGKE